MVKMKKSAVISFVESQKSLHLYKNIKEAFVEVLCKLSDKEFEKVKDELIVMAFHGGVVGQVMHFPAKTSKFAVMQLYIPKEMPKDVLKHVVAHELGHVMQGRNYLESDGNKLEDNANKFALKLGYARKKNIDEWLNSNR
jgi:hypothetical protein